jgi:uncharacterized phiE125 gp8 family phage protein
MGMVTRVAVTVDAFALDEVKTYLRIDGETEDSALAALIATAVEQCEAYVGVAVLQRAMTEVIVPGAAWQLLSPTPVRVISTVAALQIGGATTALPASAYEIDIDTYGRGRVRFLAPVYEKRVLVSVEAGLAATWAGLSESLRHGIVRLVSHYHVYRDRADELGPPAAVVALWRGSRRVRLS